VELPVLSLQKVCGPNMYYVNDNACPTLEDALEVQQLYQIAGIAVEILTEEEYFATMNYNGTLLH
jgi:hypothetical protein